MGLSGVVVRSAQASLQRWLHPAVFGAWAGVLIYLLASGRYTIFLRPALGLLLFLALFIALGFTVAAMICNRTAAVDRSGVLRALVLVLPLAYLISMPDTMLGGHVFKKRYIGPVGLSQSHLDLPNPAAGGIQTGLGPPLRPEEGGEAMGASALEQTILELFLDPSRYHGQRVVFSGMFLRDEQLKPYFGDRETAVFRFLINCCAADALPLAIAVNSDQTEAFSNDQWVRVDGIFEVRQISGKPVPLVNQAALTPIEPPRMPYLF